MKSPPSEAKAVKETQMADHGHRHVLPGNLLTGPTLPAEGGAGNGSENSHKHKIVGGEQMTSVVAGGDDNHRHTANGQGTSGPRPINDTQLADMKANLRAKS